MRRGRAVIEQMPLTRRQQEAMQLTETDEIWVIISARCYETGRANDVFNG